MQVYSFSVDTPLHYAMTGKFKAPSPDWQHQIFPLQDYELIVMTEGSLYIADDNGKYQVCRGEHLLLSPTPDNTRYGYIPSDCSFYWLHFSYKDNILMADSLSLPVSDSRISIPVQGVLPAPEKVVILMKQIQDSIRAGYNSTFLDYITTTVLCEIHNQFLPRTMADTSEARRQIYNDILDYIRLTLSKNVRVSDIAEHFGYNEKYLSHLFSTIEGMPLKQYILHEKMERAKYLLTDSNDTISQIASSLSYTDSHSFMKVFKKVVGLTPSQYRNAFNKRLLYDR